MPIFEKKWPYFALTFEKNSYVVAKYINNVSFDEYLDSNFSQLSFVHGSSLSPPLKKIRVAVDFSKEKLVNRLIAFLIIINKTSPGISFFKLKFIALNLFLEQA